MANQQVIGFKDREAYKGGLKIVSKVTISRKEIFPFAPLLSYSHQSNQVQFYSFF